MTEPDIVAELAALLKEAGARPTLYGRPVDLVAFRDDLRGELHRAVGRAVARHLLCLDRLALLAAISCDHSGMAECRPGCGHFACPCGVSWDEGAGR